MAVGILRAVLFVLVLVCNIGLARGEQDEDESFSYSYATLQGKCDAYDPFEPLNRKMLWVNGFLDFVILSPVAKVYHEVTNPYMRARVDSLIANTDEPLNFVNYALQRNGLQVFNSLWRFIINSTLGICGIFDVASQLGLHRSVRQTFANTFGYYGMEPGPYLMVPVLGGLDTRELFSELVGFFVNPLGYVISGKSSLSLFVLKTVHTRAENLNMDFMLHNSPDIYVRLRSSIVQHRESTIQYPPNFRCTVRPRK